MKSLLKTTALATLLVAPAVASAQEVTLSYGATLTSRYLASGIEQTTGAAFQPWLEVDVSGFYAGVWASNTDAAITGSDYEIDLYAGYRGEAGVFTYDIGYARYFYTSPSMNCCGEIILSLGVAPNDKLGMGVRFALDPQTDVLNSSINFGYAFTDAFSVAAEIGSISKGGHDYYSIGASYALTDTLAITASWNDTTITNDLVVVSLDVAF